MEQEVHIAGLLVQVQPEQRRKLTKDLAALPGTEVRASAKAGKLVVVWEGGSGEALVDLIGRIREMPGVLNVALVYQHVESAEAMEEVITDEADTPRVH